MDSRRKFSKRYIRFVKSLASEIGNKTVVIYGGTPVSFLAAQDGLK